MSPAPRRIIVVGAGGLAREVKWLLQALEPHFRFVGYAVSTLSADNPREAPSRSEIVGDLQWLRKNRSQFDGLALGIGTPAVREKLAAELADFGAELWPALTHPTAQIDRASAAIGHGAIVAAGVIATVNVVLEPFCLVNLSCTIGHEATVGRASVLNPSVNVSGGVSVGPRVLVGTGAQLLEYVSIGEGATVGAGAVVTKDVSPGVTVVGVPAKPLNRD